MYLIKFLITLLPFFCQANEYLVADTTPLSRKTYRIKVNEKEFGSFTGYLHNINDSSVTVSTIHMPFGKTPETKQQISFLNINSITIRKKGSVGSGFLYGALSGIVVGGIIGAITYTPCNSCFFDFGVGFDILAGGLLGLVPGGLTGALIGGKKQKFQINKQKENFQAMREKMWMRIYPQKKNDQYQRTSMP